MKIENAQFKSVEISAAVTFPLKAGTPISIGGNVANDANAIGIVPKTIALRPLTGKAYILTAGDVELAEVEREYGSALTAEAKAAMNGIRFFGDYGADPHYLEKDDAYVLPAATTTILGGVKQAAAVGPVATGVSATAAANAAAINALLEALRAAGVTVPFAITTQPQNASVAAEATATFSVVAVGDSLTYQWQKKSGASWVKAGGSGTSAQTATYTFTATSDLNGTQYRCKVDNSAGATLYTNIVTLTVTT